MGSIQVGALLAVASLLFKSSWVEQAHQYPRLLVMALGAFLMTTGKGWTPALFWPAMGVLGAHLLATFIGVDWRLGMVGIWENPNQGLVTLTILYLLYAGISGLEDALILLRRALGAVMVVFFFYGLYQFVDMYPTLPMGRVTSLMGHPAFLGGVVAVSMPVLLDGAMKRERFSVIALVYGTILIALARAKGGAVAAFAGCLAYGCLNGGIRLPRAFLSVLAVPLFFAGAERWELWKIAARSWLDHPLFGWGPGTYLLAFRQHRTDAYISLLGSTNKAQADAHMDILQILVTTGVVGFLAYAWLWFEAGRQVLKNSRIESERETAAVVGGVLVAAFIQAKTNPMPIPALVAIALVLGCLKPIERPGSWVRTPLAIGAVLATFSMLIADHHYLNGIRAKSPQEALAPLRAAVRWNPLEIIYRMRLQDALVKTGIPGNLKIAEMLALKLTRSRPNHPSSHEAIGHARLKLGNLKDAYLSLTKAQTLDPKYRGLLVDRSAIGEAVNPTSKTLAQLKAKRDEILKLENGRGQNETRD